MRPLRCVGVLSIGVLALYLSGCATASRSLRSQPSSHFQVEDYPLPQNSHLEGLVALHCTRVAAVENHATKKECEYISADITNLVKKLPENQPDSPLRDATLDLLMGISDYNCSNFLSRAFAVRSTFDVTSSFIADLATALSAGTVTAAPAVSVGLDAVNLLVGKANSNFDMEFYQGEAFYALEAALASERTKRKTDILARRSTPKYSLMNALSDARFYDDACSIKVGIASLAEIARSAAQEQKNKNLAVQNEQPENRANKAMSFDKNR